jgi:hypothetical protein
MPDEKHLTILARGVKSWNFWRQNSSESPDLRSADLSGSDLRDANFTDTDLTSADLSNADLSNARLSRARLVEADLFGTKLSSSIVEACDFRGADLSKAELRGVILVDSNFNGAYLYDADLTGSNLTGANLRLAHLNGANFTDVLLGFTTLADCDLSEVEGLDSVAHEGPSSIGVDAIYESKGKIPEGFLRGCGVPEIFIRYIPSLVNSEEGIQFYSCFISYSSKDEEFARRLHGRMRDAHLRVWFAPVKLQGGQKLHEQIETAIRVHDKLLIVLSEASLQSEWVMTELRKARKAERQSGKRKLFPVRLVDYDTLREWECFDADSGKDLAVELREYFIPDFSNWKEHDQFEIAFARLLKDLRSSATAA